jgi:type II secretory pathway component GspD/PulD (secretin)
MRSSTPLRTLCCIIVVVFLCLLCSGQQPLRNPASVFQTDTGQKRIDLDIVNMDVSTVLKIISDAGGWTIIPSKKVTENTKVSLWCKGAGARQLLEKLCLVNSYVYKEEEGNLIYLMTKDEYDQVFGGMSRMFVLNFQRAEAIKPLIESSLTKTGKMGFDPWSNTIVVNDTAENLQKVESMIAKLDQGFEHKRFQLTHAKAIEVAQIIERIYPKEGSVQVDVRTNALVVFSSQGCVARIEELIARLDEDRITKVFAIRFQSAVELARQLSGLLGSSSGYGSSSSIGAAAAPAAGAGASSPSVSVGSSRNALFDPIVVSETTNQIIATGSAAEIEYIEDLIQELDSQVITTTIPLKRLKAATVMTQIAHLASRPENITADLEGNSLIIRDNSNNVEQIRKILLELDEALVTKVITLQFALASDVENVLQSMVTNPEAFRADPRTNQIVISDSASQVARMEEIIAKLDAEDAYFTRTFHLLHAPASGVADVIEKFLSRQRPRQTASAPDRGVDRPAAEPGAGAPQSRAAVPSTRAGSPVGTASQSPGSSPGLSGVRGSAREGAAGSAVPPAAPSASQPGAASAAGESSQSLGTAGMVVADDRSNTVTITETLSLLTKIEQLIGDLDVPVKAYCYTAQYRQLDVQALDKMIPGFLRPKEDGYFLDEQNRSIHFTTIPSVAERLTSVLKEWDRPVRQVLIRAKIVTVSTSTLRDIGVNFETILDVDGADLTVKSSFPSQVTADHSGTFSLRKLTGTEFEAVIRAIEADNRSHILANPRILAMDNKPAEVRMATDEPFTETSIDSNSGARIENVKFLQVGTVLAVTPRIKEDRTIEMEIAMDVSSLVEIRNGIPVVNRNIASSGVAVKDNHVLMIGGLRFNRDMSVKEKVPIIGDIPVLGWLFRSDRKERQDTELVLFLQPTIVDSAEGTERLPDPNEFKDSL